MQTALDAAPETKRQYIPNPHYMLSVRNQNLPWWKALAELIDNSFDHGATGVSIALANNAIEVQDDGSGMKSVESAVTFGEHIPCNTTKLGMYGVGLKDAWLAMGDTIEIVSTHKGVRSRLTMNINELMANNWYGPVATTEESVAASGTTIRLQIRRQRNKPSNDVWETLAWAFTPALESGRQIVKRTGKKKSPLAAFKLPKMVERITETIEVAGKKVDIDVGIIAEGEQVFRGPFWIIYGHRIIRPASIGAKNFSTLRLAGAVTLGEGWSLTKNKDDLSEYTAELDDAIHQRILPLLKNAEQLTEEIESSALKAELESLINDSVGGAKREARDNKKESIGTVEPVNSGAQRRRASKTSSLPGSVGDAIAKRKRGIQFGWCSQDSDTLGRFDPLCNRVDLNINHPFVTICKRENNRMALYSIAVAIYSEYACNVDTKGRPTLFEVQDFGQCFGLIMKSLKVQDGDRK